MKRVLVVDDDPLICSAIRAWLEHDGFDVVLADSGNTGLIALGRSKFDVVVVDIFMPNMDGLESIRSFRRCDPTVPIIAISGLMFRERRGPAPDFLRMATDLGAAYCLRKPFRPRELLQLIDRCLSRPAGGLEAGIS